MKTKLIKQITCAALLLTSVSLNAQTWHKQLEVMGSYPKENNKGHFNTLSNRFIVTGKVQNALGVDRAHLVETDLNGNVVWNTLLGLDSKYFEGVSVKTTSLGNYIVVGRTTLNQDYRGAFSDSCELSPYYNGFVAYVDRSIPSNSWYRVLGDSFLHDELVEVIEDSYGDFVCVGTTNAKYSADTCLQNDTNYVTNLGSDIAKILVCKVGINGTFSFIKSYDASAFHQGVSLVQNGQHYDVLVSSRTSTQTGLNKTSLMTIDLNGNWVNSQEYSPLTGFDIIPKEVILVNGDHVIVGETNDLVRNRYSSFWLVVRGALITDFKVLQHNDVYINYQDVIEHLDTLVVSASSMLNGNNWETQSTQKAVIDASGKITLVNYNTSNTFHYHSYYTEYNENIVGFSAIDSQLTPQSGYHLFGNTYDLDLLDHIRTDQFLMSNCTLYDSLYLDSVLTADLATLYIEDNVDSLDTFTTYPINFYVFSECDTLQPLNPTQQKLNNPEHPMKQTQVYPNPMDQYFVVELADVSNSLVSVSDQLGKSMYSVTTNQSQVRIDSSNWPAGIYFVQISSGNRTEAIKMVKM